MGDLALTHFKASKGGTLTGISGDDEKPELNPMIDNGLRDARCAMRDARDRAKNTCPS